MNAALSSGLIVDVLLIIDFTLRFPLRGALGALTAIHPPVPPRLPLCVMLTQYAFRAACAALVLLLPTLPVWMMLHAFLEIFILVAFWVVG